MNKAHLFFGSYIVAVLLQCYACVLVDIRNDQQAIVQMHNSIRRQEPAANMNALVWDNNIANKAARWTETCNFEHQGRGYGENLAYTTFNGSPPPSRNVVKSLFGLWAGEKPLWGRDTECGAACHYTQLIWATTTRVGCALSRCKRLRNGTDRNALYFACFYSPPGNYIGQLPFIVGERCSQCGNGMACVGGLCTRKNREM
ncbi:peptidase inhibitor 15-like [Dreissena polymorpha]|uniref:SCP domain-containing protein n=1 Tax=Dreissena polymorpha TaxID=45954 RepID=A0A9D4DN97_DREPO|nr:peptidase inhibitor 15-like [Dreissena polymorpha]XP_052236016.1 peptidase inhibitor 15-like [Dreissena polymorpha]KAH3752777.1 hypothetical protein DPMN_187403 [Dreissena polymorpha]